MGTKFVLQMREKNTFKKKTPINRETADEKCMATGIRSDGEELVSIAKHTHTVHVLDSPKSTVYLSRISK